MPRPGSAIRVWSAIHRTPHHIDRSWFELMEVLIPDIALPRWNEKVNSENRLKPVLLVTHLAFGGSFDEPLDTFLIKLVRDPSHHQASNASTLVLRVDHYDADSYESQLALKHHAAQTHLRALVASTANAVSLLTPTSLHRNSSFRLRATTAWVSSAHHWERGSLHATATVHLRRSDLVDL